MHFDQKNGSKTRRLLVKSGGLATLVSKALIFSVIKSYYYFRKDLVPASFTAEVTPFAQNKIR